MSNPYSSFPQNQGGQQGQTFPGAIPQPPAGIPQPPHYFPIQRSRVAAAILAFLFGGLGAADFYLGYKKSGMWKLGLTLLGVVLLFLAFVLFLQVWVDSDAGNDTTVTESLMVLAYVNACLFLGAAQIVGWVTFICILISKGKYKTDANGVPLC